MQTGPETGRSRSRCWNRWLLYPIIALSAAGSAALADTPEAARTKTTYTVIQLSPNFSGASINAKGQVAFTEQINGVARAKFYDGKTVRDIGTLGGPTATAAAINDFGQITGKADVNADGSISHAYRWSPGTGMLDLSRKGQGNSQGNDINNKGQVAGSAVFNTAVPFITHGFFWSTHTGMLDVGALSEFSSIANVINDAGTIAGDSEGPEGGPRSILSFRWTRAEGIQSLGTLPDEFTFATAINNAGHIVGETPFTPGGQAHAYLWTQRQGLMDLGTGSQQRSIALAINNKDTIVGITETRFTGPSFGFVWTRQTGLVEITDGGNSAANDVNNREQVVGDFRNGHAFVWTREEGPVDLNTRIPGAPEGLTLITATKISDNGSIIAFANTGLVLLVPNCRCSKEAPAVSSIKWTGNPHLNVPVSFSAAFKDLDVADTHKASWSWGDGSSDAGTVAEKSGAGSASGQHAYRSPGIYTVKLTVTDSSGKSTTVQRKLVVRGSGMSIAGEGSIMSPLGASRFAPNQAGIANLALLSGGANGVNARSIEFTAPGMSLRSESVDSLSVQGGQVQYRGTANVNGVGGYHYTLSANSSSKAAGSIDRVRMRVWHDGPDSREIVDYDNLPGAASGDAGTAMLDGAITEQSN